MAKNKQDRQWGPWEVASDRGGVRLEIRKNKQTGILASRVSGVVNCPSAELWELITTPESYMELMPKTLESVHLDEKPRKKQHYCYQRLSGGPSSDRDYTLLVTWTIEKAGKQKKYFREWTVRNDHGPAEKEGVVRVRVNDGSWTLTPVDAGKTEIIQESYIELGGSLWTVLANNAIKEGALELLTNLRGRYGA